MSEKSKALARQIAEAAAQGKDAYLAAHDELFASDAVTHQIGMPEPLEGEAHKQFLHDLYSAFPDLQEVPDDILADGDKAMVRWTGQATHEGDFQGIPPTGRSFTVDGVTIYRFAGGKVKEQWVFVDMLSMLQQLGVVEPPGAEED